MSPNGQGWRFALLWLVMALFFGALFLKLTDLQVRSTDVYGASAEQMRTKTFALKGSRGQIQDVNGTVLAYDKKIYNVQFYREPGTGKTQNAAYSRAIWETIGMVESSGKTVAGNFYLKQDEAGLWYFDVGSGLTEAQELARVTMWRSNFYLKEMDTQLLFAYLSDYFGVEALDESLPEGEKLTIEDKRKILGVWQEMQMNAFSSKPINLATDVPWSTVIEIEMRSIGLDGITVAVDNQRVYPQGTLACHVVGYIGKMQTDTQVKEYQAKGYSMNDLIGLDGIEKTMEDWLTANSSQRQGQKVVEVNYSGKVISELSATQAQDGNTVRLTIDAGLQKVAETALAETINTIRDMEEKDKLQNDTWLEQNKSVIETRDFESVPLKLAQNGAIVVLDMQARVLAMASFPDYDPNLFILGMDEEQRERMLSDPRHPLFNNAIGSRDTPGSIFKMCTSLAALVNGAITPTDTISDEGAFTLYDTVNPPRCWANTTTRLSKHQDQTIVQGLQNSCNYFFYTISSRLGADGELLYQYAAKLGLTNKTNIDLPGELRSVVGSQTSLYDPTRAITEADQDTSLPVLVKYALKRHLRNVGESYNITYSDERLDVCIKALMDMAVNTGQNAWVSSIRAVLMAELGMPLEVAYLNSTVGDIYTLLNEIKWGGSQTIMTAIGQSITLLTPIAVARYVTAIANGGYVYDVTLVDSIISPSGEVLNAMDGPNLVADLSEEVAPYLPYIKAGMRGVVDEGGTAAAYFTTFPYRTDDGTPDMAGKTGTAEKSQLDVENNAWFVSFAPYENPEIVVVVYVPYGCSAGWATSAARDVIQYYLDGKQTQEAAEIPGPNSLAP